MPTAIGAIGAAPPDQMHGSVDSAMSALGGMDSEGFLKLLVAQLQYQSPLEPKDPGDLMTQTATLAQLDATQQILATQQRGLGLQQAVMAAGLVGHEVTARGPNGLPITGQVDAVRYTTAGPVLSIGDDEVLLSSVTELRRVQSAPPPDTAGAPAADPPAAAAPPVDAPAADAPAADTPAPDGTTPDGTTSDGTTPDGTTPDGTTSDGTTPDGTTDDPIEPAA